MPRVKSGYAVTFTVSEMKQFLNKHGENFTINEEEDYYNNDSVANERNDLIAEKFEKIFKAQFLG